MTVRAVAVGTVGTNAIASGVSYTPTVAAALFRYSVKIEVTAATTASMSFTYTYKDTSGTTRTDTMQLETSAGVALTNSLIIATGRYTGTALLPTSGTLTAITGTTAGTVTSVTYTLSSMIEEIQVP